MSKIKKHRTLLFSFSLVLMFSFIRYGYKKIIRPYIYDLKFERALKESAKASISCLDDKYQNMEIKNKYKVVIVTSKGGEYSYAEYFKFAAERRGWKVRVFEDNIVGYDESIISFDPDFILLMKNDSKFCFTLIVDK